MNRVINDPNEIVQDSLKGYLAAHPDLLMATGHPRVLARAGGVARGRVGVVTGGGLGHEPAFLGYVRPGLLDATLDRLLSRPARSIGLTVQAN